MVEEKLAELTASIKKCEACHLKDSRTQVVPGIYGKVNGLCFVGEAPGFNEDKQGLPFVGRSGQLLDKMMESINYTRKDVSILNVVKCRPTDEKQGNRTPKDSELKFCGERWLFKQLKLLKPKLIVTLGGISLRFFFPSAKVTKNVGNVLVSGDYRIFVTYHPAYILRNYNKIDEYSDHFKKLAVLLEQSDVKDERVSDEKQKRSEQKSLTDYM